MHVRRGLQGHGRVAVNVLWQHALHLLDSDPLAVKEERLDIHRTFDIHA